MGAMLSRTSLRFCVLLAGFGLMVSLFAHGQDGTWRRGRKYKAPPPTARIEVTVVRNDDGKPIRNAAVIFHPIEGDKDKGSLELKSNEEGKAMINVLPIGDTVQLQVIANGYQTFGQNYKVDKPSLSMVVRMNRPVREYSIYKNQNANKGTGNNANPPQGQAPSTPNGNGSGGNQPQPSK